jgi:hypothetical protein
MLSVTQLCSNCRSEVTQNGDSEVKGLSLPHDLNKNMLIDTETDIDEKRKITSVSTVHVIKAYAGVAAELQVFFFLVAKQPNSGLGSLIVQVSRSHTHTHTHTPVRVISPSQRPLRTQHTTNTREHPCIKWDSNPQSQQPSRRRPAPEIHALTSTI